MKIAIVGAGALGTVFGASLARAYDVCVLVRDDETARSIARRGGLVVDDLPPQRVVATHERSALADRDLVLVAVKAYATVDALSPLRGVLQRDAIVVSIQNGIDAAAQIADALGDGYRVAAGPTSEAARSIEAGVVTRAARGTTILGWMPPSAYDFATLDAIANAFGACGLATRAVDDSTPYLWAKLVVNAALNPISALARVTNGELLERPDLLERAFAIAREVVRVAELADVALPFADPESYVRAMLAATARNRSSMLQDVERGRPTEIEAILGTVVRRAAAAELAVPRVIEAYDEVRRLTNA